VPCNISLDVFAVAILGVQRGEAPGYELSAISSWLIVSEWGTKGVEDLL
jgi:hypothetical protein